VATKLASFCLLIVVDRECGETINLCTVVLYTNQAQTPVAWRKTWRRRNVWKC